MKINGLLSEHEFPANFYCLEIEWKFFFSLCASGKLIFLLNHATIQFLRFSISLL